VNNADFINMFAHLMDGVAYNLQLLLQPYTMKKKMYAVQNGIGHMFLQMILLA